MKMLIPLVLSILPANAGDEKKPSMGVDVSLISENVAVVPGRPFNVGLKIHHHENYHTYWKSPGIAGVATEIAWELPEGFSAGKIQWPYPEKSFMAKYPVHGYERDVVLLVEIKPPADIKAQQVSLKASATWMACAAGCYPGKADLALTLPVSAEAGKEEAVASVFEQTRAELPRPLEGWDVVMVSVPDAPEIRIILKSNSGGEAALPADTYFFSSDGQISSDKPQRLEKKGEGSYEMTFVRSVYSPKGVKSLPGVLAASSPLGSGAKFASINPVSATLP